MKIWPFDQFSERSFGQRITQAEIEKGLIPVKQIRDAVGDQMEIGIECHFRWNRVSMERIARALEPYNILFLEDVMPAVYPDEIKALAHRTTIPIVGSELLMTRWQLREWLEKHVSQIVMTDAVWNGGIAETRKIAALAETFGVPLVLHNVAGPICHAACMHLGAHIPNLFYVESARAFYREVFPVLSDFAPRVADGHLGYPVRTGLGRQAAGFGFGTRRPHTRSLGRRRAGSRPPRHGRSLGGRGYPLVVRANTRPFKPTR